MTQLISGMVESCALFLFSFEDEFTKTILSAFFSKASDVQNAVWVENANGKGFRDLFSRKLVRRLPIKFNSSARYFACYEINFESFRWSAQD